jgi:Ni/Co efflux regulator RcnB
VSDSSATLGVFLDVTSTEALMKRVLTTAMAAALLLFTVASASAAREKPDATSTTISPNVRETIPDRAAERRASGRGGVESVPAILAAFIASSESRWVTAQLIPKTAFQRKDAKKRQRYAKENLEKPVLPKW